MNRPWLAVLILAISINTAYGFEFRDLWRTPDQRAMQQLQNDNFDALIEDAPDARWRGIGQYRAGDYQSAVEAFAEDVEAIKSIHR